MKTVQTEKLTTRIFDTRQEMGKAAAAEAAACIRKVLEKKPFANVIFAAAPSQNEMLENLLQEDVDFTRINAFHMDEYLGLAQSNPASFASYLTEHIFGKAPFHQVFLIPAEKDADEACRVYAKLLKENPPDIVCMGIGENGHIAFNDPPVANFRDPEQIKAVKLDEICRQQQVNDGCFADLEQVPRYALTLTIPAMMAADYLVCTVPAITKAQAVKQMLTGPVGEACPATALRGHNHAVMFLDKDSASLL